MGRPLNDKFFTLGDDGEGGAFNPGNKPGLQIRLTIASYTGGPANDTNSYIIRQRSPERYEVTNGNETEVLRMINATGTAPAGRCALRVLPFEGGSTYVRTLTSHHVKAWNGTTYIWTHLQNGNAADANGEVDFSPTML